MAEKALNRRTIAKFKLPRRMGENIWGSAKCPTNSNPAGPGQHGGRRKKLTDYGIQLREKQKLKGYYGNINERQFRNIFAEASRRKGDTSENLIGLLESRLDTIVYRLNWAPTVFASRQLVNHKHVMVNGQVVNIPSYRCKPGDVITLREGAKTKKTEVIAAIEKAEREVPAYLSGDPSAGQGQFIRIPHFDEVPYAVQMNPNLVVEFYSR